MEEEEEEEQYYMVEEVEVLEQYDVAEGEEE